MGFLDKIISSGGSKILDTYGKDLFNNLFKGIATVKAIRLEGKKPVFTLTLEGMPEKDITVTVGIFTINDEGTKIMVGDYTSDMPFMQNVLNKYAVRTFEVDDPKVVMALKTIKTVF